MAIPSKLQISSFEVYFADENAVLI